MTNNLVSLAEAKARFKRVGRTVPQFAKEMGVHPEIVRKVLRGDLKGNRGDAHKVAVALGIKDGLIIPDDVPPSEALRRGQS